MVKEIKENLAEIQKKFWLSSESSRIVRLQKAEKRFDVWRRNQQDSSKNRLCLLVRWLKEDNGVVLIRNYEELISLGKRVLFEIGEIPLKEEIDKSIANDNIVKAFKDFFCKSHFYRYLEDSDINKLCYWLSHNEGGSMISRHEDFVKLASMLNSAGYNIPNTPTREVFLKAYREYLELLAKKHNSSRF